MGIYIGSNKYTGGPADPSSSMIPKSIGTTAGDMIYFSGASTPMRLQRGSNGQVLTLSNGLPTWQTPSGGGGTTVTLPSGYSASTGITLNSSTLTTIATVGGTELKLKAPAGGGNYSFKYDEFSTFTDSNHQLIATVSNTSPTEKLFTYVSVGSNYYQDVDQGGSQVVVNITTNNTTVSPGEHYLAINNQVSYSGNTLPLTVTPEMIQINGVNPTFYRVDSNDAWADIPYGTTRLYSYIILNHNGSLTNPPAAFITWCGDYLEI